MVKSPPFPARFLAPLLFTLVTVPSLLPGCASAISAVVGSVTVFCSVQQGGTQSSCVVSRNFPGNEQSTLEHDCTNQGGTVVSACPATGLVGCCTQYESAAGATVEIETCAYSGTASALKTQCSGTWSTSP